MKTLTFLTFTLVLLGCSSSDYSPIIDCEENDAGVYPVWCAPTPCDDAGSGVTKMPTVR